MSRYLAGLLVGLGLGLLLATTPAQGAQYAAPPRIIGQADFNAAINVLSQAEAYHQWWIDHGDYTRVWWDRQWDEGWVDSYAKIIILLKLQRGD